MQFKVKHIFFYLAYSVLNTSHTDQSWKVKSQLGANSKFLCTRGHVNNIRFVCAMHLMVHQVRNQPLLTNCCFHREPSLAVIHQPCLSESMLFKSHEDKGRWANC